MRELTLILFGGLFGWALGQLPSRWVYAVLAVAIALAILTMQGVI